MRRLALAALLSAAASGLAGTPARAEGSWYISGSVGGYFREDASGPETITNHIITATGTDSASFDPGVVANIAVGHRLPRHLRIELEAGYADYQTGSVHPSSGAFPTLNGQAFNRQTGADNVRYSGTVNIFFDFPPVFEEWVPYIGGGIGGVHSEATRGHFVDANGNGFNEAGGQATRGIVLIEGGVSFELGDGIAIVPAYRYIHYFVNTPPRGDEVAHVAKVGLRYSF